MRASLDKLQLFLLPGRNPARDIRAQYEAAYSCWREVWDHTFAVDFPKAGDLYSDAFTRQDEIAAVFYEERCIAMALLRWVDGKEQTTLEDSYFRLWSEIAMKKLRKEGDQIMVCSFLTIHPEFRGKIGGFRGKDILGALLGKRLLASDRDVMTGTLRTGKGITEAAVRTGAEPVCLGVETPTLGVVDLVAFYRSRVASLGPSPMDSFIERVWSECHAFGMPLIEGEEDEIMFA